MRMINIMAAVLSILILINPAYAHMEEIKSVDGVMNDMMANQNVIDVTQLDCSKISDEKFEELGDAVMERMVGDHELHERMDLMMGGEGSESLEQMHVVMGENWLGCGVGFQSMMESNMMPMMMRMMGSYYPAYYSGYNTLLVFSAIGWIVSVALAAVVVLAFLGKIAIGKNRK